MQITNETSIQIYFSIDNYYLSSDAGGLSWGSPAGYTHAADAGLHEDVV